jgi:hypothetical protein
VKRGFGPAKWLANPGEGKIITKTARKQPQTVHLRHEQEIKWEIPDEIQMQFNVVGRAAG